jgi:hypothetical protein
LARRITAFWPVISPISSITESSSLAFLVASPSPTLITIFSSFGTCIGV